jgi:hypothetical protein
MKLPYTPEERDLLAAFFAENFPLLLTQFAPEVFSYLDKIPRFSVYTLERHLEEYAYRWCMPVLVEITRFMIEKTGATRSLLEEEEYLTPFIQTLGVDFLRRIYRARMANHRLIIIQGRKPREPVSKSA